MIHALSLASGIGGLALGEGRPTMLAMIEASIEPLPEDRPRYLMGVGEPGDVLEAIGRGVDMFDCVFPTRVARNGLALTWGGRLGVRNAPAAGEDGPIDPACGCQACTRYGRAYLRHLIRAATAANLTRREVVAGRRLRHACLVVHPRQHRLPVDGRP